MVIEVTKEVDVVRIGIDRYSLKTGLKFRTVMDVSVRVLKEPRGFIRVIQCVMAILAFSTTAAFSTLCQFTIQCDVGTPEEVEEYSFGYPFLFKNNQLNIKTKCGDDEENTMTLPFDFSNSAEFFVANGVISFLYALLILLAYIFFHQTYTNNPKVPVVDLALTAMLSVFWLAGSCAWAQGASDLKYYLHPDNLFGLLCMCKHHTCETVSDGSYATLNASLVLGFANFFLWLSSLWFIYKETIFHTPTMPDPQTQNQTVKNDGRV